MSDSPITAGFATLPDHISEEVLRDAESKIDSNEVRTRLPLLQSQDPGRTDDRVRLFNSEAAVEVIYAWYRDQADKTPLAQLMGTTVDSVARQTPAKLVNLHIYSPYGSYFWFPPRFATVSIVEITISPLPGATSIEYVKGSHRMDRNKPDWSTVETTSVPLRRDYIIILKVFDLFK
ncbi:MAG: hypothetical protein M1840_000550 [Geoglossum simile]|nr:MAG: hypothetical protein M1840_000550 [Geoglossum simile]